MNSFISCFEKWKIYEQFRFWFLCENGCERVYLSADVVRKKEREGKRDTHKIVKLKMRKQEIIAQKLHVFRTFAYFVCLNCCAVTVHIETDKTTTKIKNERPNQVQGVCVSVYVLLIYFRVPSRCSKLLIYLCCVLCVCASISSFFFSFAVFLFSPHSRVPIFSNRYTVRSVHSVYVFALRYYKISSSMDYTKTRARRKRHTFFVGRVNKVFFST